MVRSRAIPTCDLRVLCTYNAENGLYHFNAGVKVLKWAASILMSRHWHHDSASCLVPVELLSACMRAVQYSAQLWFLKCSHTCAMRLLVTFVHLLALMGALVFPSVTIMSPCLWQAAQQTVCCDLHACLVGKLWKAWLMTAS